MTFNFIFKKKGDQECYVEIDNLDADKKLNESKTMGINQQQQHVLNIFSYTGILYTQTDKKYIQFKLKDFYSNNNSILINGIIPSKFGNIFISKIE